MTFPIFFNPESWDPHVLPVFLGGTEVSDDNYVISAPSLQMVYFVAVDTKRQFQLYVFVWIYLLFMRQRDSLIRAYRTVSF